VPLCFVAEWNEAEEDLADAERWENDWDDDDVTDDFAKQLVSHPKPNTPSSSSSSSSFFFIFCFVLLTPPPPHTVLCFAFVLLSTQRTELEKVSKEIAK